MCGIAGFFDLRAAAAGASRAIVQRMNTRLFHRGPDSEGVFVEGPVALGCRRLAIVDVAGGDQPLTSEDGQIVVVCNGEIWNHAELRAAAQARGHRFASRVDVEVLVHLYEDYGDALLDHLDGQFAFALYDRRRQRLLLARDGFGIAPLHFTRVPGGLVFASEIKALLAHPAVSAAVDPTGVDQIFAFPGLVSPRTALRGIQSLRPGHALAFDATGLFEHQFWDLDYPTLAAPVELRSEAEWAEALADALARAVRRRLQGDLPVGCYLSGGLDSSLLLALLAEATPGAAPSCFSVGFADGAIDERTYQRLVVAATGARHHLVEQSAEAIPERFARMLLHAECPVKESYNTASMALAEAVHGAGIKVVLSGEGADELFAGYPGYRIDTLRATPVASENDFQELLERDLRRQVFGDPELFYESRLAAGRALRRELYAQPVREEFDLLDCLEQPVVDTHQLRGRHRLHQRSYLDVKLRLGDHLLSDHGDRMAMAASVEVRYPFLDREVVALARRMPPAVKLRHGRAKAVVRDAARRLLPATIVDREKMGFHAPGTPWLLRHAGPWIRDLLSPARMARQGLFDPQAVAALTAAYARPGFRLELPLEDDLLMIVLSYSVLADQLGLAGP